MRKMNRSKRVALALCLVLSMGGLRVAGSVFTPSIDRWVVSAGGATSTGGSYSLSGTAGQVEAGSALAGGSYQLTSGFWYVTGQSIKIYLPLVLRE